MSGSGSRQPVGAFGRNVLAAAEFDEVVVTGDVPVRRRFFGDRVGTGGCRRQPVSGMGVRQREGQGAARGQAEKLPALRED